MEAGVILDHNKSSEVESIIDSLVSASVEKAKKEILEELKNKS